MTRLFFFILTICIVHSCALNKTFLNPRQTIDSGQYKVYSHEKKDTITMDFHPIQNPTLSHSDKSPLEKNYSIKNSYFINSNEDSTNYWLITPDNYNGTTLYFLHGNSGNIPFNFPLAEPFAKKGYQVFMVDYSGFGYSKGKLKRKNALSCGNDGLNHLIKTVKYDKLIIYGQSLGGHLSCVVAHMNQDKIDGLVVEGAFSSHKDIAAESVPFLSRIVVREIYSGEKSLPKLNKPVLIIHSTEDARIPFTHGERLFEVANEPKMFYQIEKRHIFGPLYYLDSITEKIDLLLALNKKN